MQAGYPGDGRSRVIASVALVALATAGSAMAQAWPAKPIRIIVPYAPGGPFDEVARILSQRMNESWGQPVMVENRSGAGGSIAAELVARSAPDGYTLLHGNAGPITINPSLMRKVGYDPVRDFAPVSLLLTSAMVLVVHPSLPVRSVADLVRLARAHPGELNYASAGIGNLQHLGMESLQAMAGIRMNHVPYKGGAPAMLDLVAGQVSLMFDNIPTAIAQVRAGKVRALGVAQAKRTPAAPDIPTLAEAGFPGFEVTSWQGFLAPAGTPAAVVNRLNAEILRVLAQPDVRERLTAQGIEIVTSTPQELAAIIKRDAEIWAKVVKATGARID